MITIWNQQALDGWQEIAEYIFDDFGYNALLQFQNLTNNCISNLETFPFSGVEYWLDEKANVQYRSCVINHRSIMVYYIENETIHIADFFDSRRRPKRS